MPLILEALPQPLAVCKVNGPLAMGPEQGFFVYAQTDCERSLVCAESGVPPDALACERGFQGYRVRGTLDFSLVGILARLTAALAEGGISVFAVSTYDTDYLLVRQADAKAAETAWRAAGAAVAETQG